MIFILTALPFWMQAQRIGVYERDTGEPIPQVAVFNADRSVSTLSDANGRVDLSAFSERERITFRHIGFQRLVLTKNAILANGGRIYLEVEPEQLEEIVMSVSKWEQQKREIPQKIETIDASSIAFANPQTAADLLQQSGKVFVQKSQYGGGSPLIRGFATNRVLLSVDGVRMNNAIFRGGNVQNVISIDPFAVRSTEVLFGPGSVIYGSDAIGGVMNFYTRAAQLSPGDSLIVAGNGAYRTATASGEQTLHADLNLGWERWASLTSVSYSRFGDLIMGRHGPADYLRPRFIQRIDGEDQVVANPNPRKQVPSGYDQINLMQKIAYRPNKQWDADLGLHYSETSDYARYDRLIRPAENEAGLRSAAWYYGPQKWFLGNLQLARKGGGAFYEGLKLGGAYQFFEESRNERNFRDSLLYRTRERVDAYSLTVDLETRKSAGFQAYYGLEYVLNKVGSRGSRLNVESREVSDAPSRYPDGSTWQSAAAYLNTTYKIQPKISLMGGLRYTHTWISARFDSDFYDFPFQEAVLDNGALTGSLGMSWFPGKNTQITVNGSTGFRAPNIDDIGKIFDSEPGSVVVPNPDLEPEYAYNAEIGVRQNIRDKWVLRGAAYYTYLVDALVRRDFALNGERTILYNGVPSNVQAIQNAARAYVYGLEFGFDGALSESWSLTGNLTLTEGTEEDDQGLDSPARHVAPTFADLHLKWDHYPWKASIFLNYNGEMSFGDLAFSERRKPFIYAQDADGNPFAPSWYTLNLRSAYTFRQNYQITLAVENLTDQRYRTYSSGIAAPGINLIAGLRVRL